MTTALTDNGAFKQSASNINLLWASLCIEELIRYGIEDFCIAPGSRSTPLTLAVATHPKAKAHTHFDERGLGFLALGLSLASQKPVVVITTSGTAVANLYPAVIEAKQSAVPLIILSADRPPELINCGANQAIEQSNIFANYPVFFAQIATPTTKIKPSYLLTTIDQGLSRQTNNPAPIHFNLAFSEPFYPQYVDVNYQAYLKPLNSWLESKRVFTFYNNRELEQAPEIDSTLQNKKVLVLIARMTNKQEAQAISQFAQAHHYPLLADIQSSVCQTSNNIYCYDLLLITPHFKKVLNEADIIIQFGDQLISKRLSQFIDQFNGQYWLIKEGESRIDPNHNVTTRFNVPATQWIKQYNRSAIDKSWLMKLTLMNQQLSDRTLAPFLTQQDFSEIGIIDSLDKIVPANSPLFIGNSMPIRLCDMLMNKNDADIFSNRGASGIDGLLASAIGIAKNSSKCCTLLIGDTSFLYDLNSLALLKQLNSPFVIIVINNDGGSIFNLLDVPKDQKQNFYQLPHGLTFASSCQQFDIDYYQPSQLNEFEGNYNKALKNRCSMIEICVNNEQTSKQLTQLKEQINDVTF